VEQTKWEKRGVEQTSGGVERTRNPVGFMKIGCDVNKILIDIFLL
jgi:hypothetical protein